jgi:hypothetical protein
MEYLLGSLVTILALFILRRSVSKDLKNEKYPEIKYQQSRIFEMVKPFLAFQIMISPRPKTQASIYDDKKNIRVVISEKKAYWILDNTFFVADQIDGLIDKDTTRPVDTISMDKEQLEKMMIIVETLTEGDGYEDWNSRN